MTNYNRSHNFSLVKTQPESWLNYRISLKLMNLAFRLSAYPNHKWLVSSRWAHPRLALDQM